MPRPKQSRNARLQIKPTVAALAPAAVRAQREESTETDIYGHSDRENERLRQVQQRQREAAAAGARATRPVPNQTQTHAGSDTSSTLSAGGPAETRTRQTRPRGGPLKRLTDPLGSTATSTSEEGAAVRPGRGGDGGRRVAATPLALRDFSGLEIPDSDGFGNIDASFEDGDDEEEGEPRGRTVANAGSAPGLRYGHRRGSSVNRPGDAPIRPTSRGLTTPNISSTFNIGAFRRRAREPSILATARKERQSDSVVIETDSEDVDSDTNLDRDTSPARGGGGGGGGVATPQPAAGKKRKSSEGHTAGDRAEKSIRIDPARLVADEASSSDLSTPVSPLAVLPPLIYDRPRPATPVRPELETIAPPVSGGSNDSALWPDVRALGKRRRRRLTHPALPKHGAGADEDLDDDISSLPSLTHSPNLRPAAKAVATRARNRAAAAAKAQPSPRVTTAELTSLLPTRRPKRTLGSDNEDDEDEDGEQLDVSTLGPDDDELSYLDARAGRRARTRRGGALVKGQPAVKAAKKTAGKAKKQGAASVSRTYGSRRDNDGDDDDDEDGGGGRGGGGAGLPQSTPDHPVHSGGTGRASGQGEEIANAIKKFREVDQWELAFEEAVGSSSPANAR